MLHLECQYLTFVTLFLWCQSSVTVHTTVKLVLTLLTALIDVHSLITAAGWTCPSGWNCGSSWLRAVVSAQSSRACSWPGGCYCSACSADFASDWVSRTDYTAKLSYSHRKRHFSCCTQIKANSQSGLCLRWHTEKMFFCCMMLLLPPCHIKPQWLFHLVHILFTVLEATKLHIDV